VCYYELLGVDRKCDPADIKASYRKLALRMHPDKAHLNGLSVEEATHNFQQIQEAYACLSDVQERAWYDAHREQILRGGDEQGADPFKTKINLYKYFSASCYTGYTDRPTGFFTVYSELFEAIDQEEAEWEDADEDHTALPPFGSSGTEWSDVSFFYRHWLDFVSRKAFGHADKWNSRDAPNRQTRRLMEQENKKARQAAKKEFNAEVRQLVAFVQRRDPRVAEREKQQMKEKSERTQRELANKEAKKALEAAERDKRREAARKEEEERWAEVEAYKNDRRRRGETVSDEEVSETEVVGVKCVECRKTFKSEKQYEQHAKSKKHLQVVAELRRQFAKELREKELQAALATKVDSDSSASESSNSASCSDSASDSDSESGSDLAQAEHAEREETGSATCSITRNQNSKQSHQVATSSDSEDSTGSDKVVGFHRGSKPKAQPRNDLKAVQSMEINDREDHGEPGACSAASGKRAQKRDRQKEVLLSKRAERENVQNLVRTCKKVSKAVKQGSDQAVALEADADVSTRDGKAACAEATGDPSTAHLCSVCGQEFTSRTKLFQHVRDRGHAALKEEPQKPQKKKR